MCRVKTISKIPILFKCSVAIFVVVDFDSRREEHMKLPYTEQDHWPINAVQGLRETSFISPAI